MPVQGRLKEVHASLSKMLHGPSGGARKLSDEAVESGGSFFTDNPEIQTCGAAPKDLVGSQPSLRQPEQLPDVH